MWALHVESCGLWECGFEGTIFVAPTLVGQTLSRDKRDYYKTFTLQQCGTSGHCITGDLAWDNRCISGFHFFVGRINNQFIIRRWGLLVITLACLKVSLRALWFSLLTKQAFDLI